MSAAGDRTTPDASANFDRAAAFMRELAEVVRIALDEEQTGIAEARLVEIAERCSKRACQEFAGQLVYIPFGLAMWIFERDRALYDFYVAHRRDINATAKEFKCTVQTAYKRVRLIEAAELNARQGGLFDAES